MKGSIISLVIVSIISLTTLVSNAQVCKIAGSSNDTVEVYSATLTDNDNYVEVTVGNDSNLTNANVTVKVEVTYGKYGTQTFIGKGLARANSTTVIKVKIDPRDASYNKYGPTSIEVTEISGTKCQ